MNEYWKVGYNPSILFSPPAATERLVLERQDTLKPSEEPKETETLGAGFSECNPFAQEFGIGATPPTQESLTGDLPPPPTQEDLDQTLVHADNPFTADLFADNVVETPSSSTATIEPSVKSGELLLH